MREDHEAYNHVQAEEPFSAECLNRYLWYLKESRVGVSDTISGKVIYPNMEAESFISRSSSDLTVTSFG
jgi:hypothetical protein